MNHSQNFDNAAGIISNRLRHADGVAKVLSAIKAKLPCGAVDEVIDVSQLAEELNVEQRVVESVVKDLCRFNYIHIWCRITCPKLKTVVVETNDKDEFKTIVDSPCCNCGDMHVYGKSDLETFYALNVGDYDGQEMSFSNIFKRLSIPDHKFDLVPKDDFLYRGAIVLLFIQILVFGVLILCL